MKLFLTLLLSVTFVLVVVEGTGCSPRNDTGRYLEAADRLYERRDLEKAKEEYGNVLRFQPTNAHAISRMSKILMAQGQVQEAAPMIAWSRLQFPEDLELREHLSQVLALTLRAGTNRVWLRAELEDLLKRNPTHEQSVLLLSLLCEDRAELEALLGRLQGMSGTVGDKAVFRLARSEVLARLGRTNEVESELNAALAAEPKNPKVQAALGGFLISRGRLEDGEKALRLASELAEPQSAIRENWGRWLLQRGRAAEASAVFEGITSKAPERTGGWTGLAEALLAERQVDAAEQAVARALRLAARDAAALSTMAQVRIAMGKPAEGIRILEQVLERQPRATGIHYQMARAHLANQDSARAITALERCLQIDSGAIQPILLLAELNLNRGEAERSISGLRALIRVRPDIEPAHISLIRAERAAGRDGDALRLAQEAHARFPGNPAFLLEKGLILRQQRRIPEARTAFEVAAQMSTNDIRVIEPLVALDVDARAFAAAHRRLDAELALNPKEPRLWLLKSETQRIQGDLTLADQYLRKTLDFDPDNLVAYFGLARNAIAAKRQKQAVEELNQVLKRDPKDLRALLMLGTLHSELGEVMLAREVYQRALAVRGDQPVMLNNLAYLLAMQLGELDEGRSLALRAREASPKNPSIADTLGWIEFKRGDYGEALRLITEAAARLPGDAEVQYHLGMAHYMMGHEEPAKVALRQAVGGSRMFAGIDEARESLALLEGKQLGTVAETIRVLEARTKEAPKDLLALLRLGAAYEAAAVPDKASAAYEAALRLNPKAVTTLSRLARFHAERGGDSARALEFARAARSLAPEDPEVASILGRLALAVGDSSWAYSLLKDGARQLSDRPEVAWDLAWAAFSQGALDDVSRSLDTVVAADRSEVRTKAAREFKDLLALALAPSASAEALAGVEAILQRQPNHGPALFASGTLAEARGEYAVAQAAYDELLGVYPSFHPAARRLAILFAEHLGQDAKARDLGVRLRELYPRDQDLALAVGKAASRIGDYAYAEQLLAPILRQRPKDPAAQYHLGVAYQGLRRGAEAMAAFEKSLSLDGRAPFAEDARKRLEVLKRG